MTMRAQVDELQVQVNRLSREKMEAVNERDGLKRDLAESKEEAGRLQKELDAATKKVRGGNQEWQGLFRTLVASDGVIHAAAMQDWRVGPWGYERSRGSGFGRDHDKDFAQRVVRMAAAIADAAAQV